MVKNGIRSSKIPTFDEKYDFVNTMMMTFIVSVLFVIFPLTVLGMLFPAFFETRLPIINVKVWEYSLVLMYLICIQIFIKIRSHERNEYNQFRKTLEMVDDEEYQRFVDLAKGEQK